jgi:hypothetical protein
MKGEHHALHSGEHDTLTRARLYQQPPKHSTWLAKLIEGVL